MTDLDFGTEEQRMFWRRTRPQDRVDVRKLPLVSYAELLVPTWDRSWTLFDLILEREFGAAVRN